MAVKVKSKPPVFACIPAYNEEKSIGAVIVQTMKYVDRVLVCDDGSQDSTGIIAERLGAVVVRHERNKGYGASIKSLFVHALQLGVEVVITIDADGQHDPREIPLLLEPLGLGKADIVIGSRFQEGGGSEAPKWRTNGIKLITGLAANGLSVTDAQSGFRAYNKRALESLVLSEQGMGVSTEILIKAQDKGLTVTEVPIHITYGEDSSTHNPLLHGLDVILSTVKHLSMRRPLLFYGLPGFISLCVSAVFWFWTFRIFAMTKTISTNVALVALSGTVVGLMLMTIAIILWVLISVVREKT